MYTLEDQNRDAQLAEDDAGVLAAAVALRYDQRPVLIGFENYDGMWWWANTPEEERRKYLRAARTACEAWEAYWEVHRVDPRDPDHSRPPPFDYHNCARCRSGEKPCARGNPHGCEYLHARND